jgi:uncharacterized membrane protein
MTNQRENRPGLPPIWAQQGHNLDTGDVVTSMVHLYRAEVSRANLWRNRLDTTTNWAVVTSGAALTFAFSSPDHPHFVMLLVLLLILTFLLIEARRYSYYALWYHRVRLLETGYLASLLAPPHEPTMDWAGALSQTLRKPEFVTPQWRSVAIRYRRNYVWLVSLTVISWLLKLSVHPFPVESTAILVQRASIGLVIDGRWVITTVILIYIALLGLTLAANLIPDPRERGPRYHRAPAETGLLRPEDQMAMIITNRREAVSTLLMERLDRGVTAVSGTGMYTGRPRDILFCALTNTQEAALREAVAEADPNAFVILTGARDVRGKGFAPMESVEPPM